MQLGNGKHVPPVKALDAHTADTVVDGEQYRLGRVGNVLATEYAICLRNGIPVLSATKQEEMPLQEPPAKSALDPEGGGRAETSLIVAHAVDKDFSTMVLGLSLFSM